MNSAYEIIVNPYPGYHLATISMPWDMFGGWEMFGLLHRAISIYCKNHQHHNVVRVKILLK